MDPIRTYEYLLVARGRLLDRVGSLSAEQYHREFPIGLGTLAKTLTHVMISECYYVQRMLGRDVPPYEQWPIRQEEPPVLAALGAAWERQAGDTRSALQGVRDWTAPIEYRVVNDDGAPEIVSASASDLFTQLVLHEVHHRAQTMNMLRHLGVAAEDLDFNALMYPRRPSPA